MGRPLGWLPKATIIRSLLYSESIIVYTLNWISYEINMLSYRVLPDMGNNIYIYILNYYFILFIVYYILYFIYIICICYIYIYFRSKQIQYVTCHQRFEGELGPF